MAKSHPRLHHGKFSTYSGNQSGTGPFPINANIQALPSTLYSTGPFGPQYTAILTSQRVVEFPISYPGRVYLAVLKHLYPIPHWAEGIVIAGWEGSY